MKNMEPASSTLKVTASSDLDVSEDLKKQDKNIEELVQAYEEEAEDI